MKIRVIAIAYIIILVLTGAFLYRKIEKRKGYEIDMLDLNTRAYNITQELSAGGAPDDLESRYNCSIVLISEDTYDAENNLFIREGYSVFDYKEADAICGKIAFAAREEEYESRRNNEKMILLLILSGALLLGLGLLFVVWYLFVRPFSDLKVFAEHVSKGNLDVPLKMRKRNYFGAFTESFDRMREELKRASDRENEANRSKKELVAELSHDIKTPVATIKATCEVMEVKYKDPDVLEKVEVIKSKANSVDQLIDNMFKATLEDLEELKVEPAEESSRILSDMVSELRFYGNVETKSEVPECLILADKLRLEQVIDNIAGNSFKYAGTPLEIEFSSQEGEVHVLFMDRGPGVPEEEISLLTSKFY
ncbi:MAG TPA: hypothetical protein DEO39_05020, partial [Clostridiales bacterium]|nr:hypothetical protein [Clostridiales bacterium]